MGTIAESPESTISFYTNSPASLVSTPGAPFEEGTVLRIQPGRYFLAGDTNATPHAYTDTYVVIRGRIVSSEAHAKDNLDPREDFEPAGGLCYRVLLYNPVKTASKDDIYFLMVPSKMAVKWRICECCPDHAVLPCPRCKQVWYCGGACQQRHWYKQHGFDCGASFAVPNATPEKVIKQKVKYMAGPRPPLKHGKGKERTQARPPPANQGLWGHGKDEPETPRCLKIGPQLMQMLCCISRAEIEKGPQEFYYTPVEGFDRQ